MLKPSNNKTVDKVSTVAAIIIVGAIVLVILSLIAKLIMKIWGIE